MQALAWLGRRATGALALGASLGIVIPGLSSFLPEFLTLLVFIFTTATFLKVDMAALGPTLRRPALPWLLIVWALVASPLVVAPIIRLMPLPEGLEEALIIWAASPPMTAAIVFAVLMKLDVALAVGVSLISLLVVPLTGPPLSLFLIQLPIDIDPLWFILRVAGFIGAAAGLAWVLRRLIGDRYLAERSDEINGLIVLTLIMFGASLMSSVRDQVLSDPLRTMKFIAVAYGVNLALQVATVALFYRTGAVRCMTAALLAGNRNMSVLCANLGAAASPEIMLFFAAVHVPIYTLPWLLRRIYGCGEGDAARVLTRRGAPES